MNVVDSSGWIEYLLDTPRADLFADPIENRAGLLVPVIALYEVHKLLSRTLPAARVATCLDVMRLGRVLELTDRRAIAAVMYSMAIEHGGSLWTQDADYQGLPSVHYFPKA